jgi:hypothetical protein
LWRGVIPGFIYKLAYMGSTWRRYEVAMRRCWRCVAPATPEHFMGSYRNSMLLGLIVVARRGRAKRSRGGRTTIWPNGMELEVRGRSPAKRECTLARAS